MAMDHKQRDSGGGGGTKKEGQAVLDKPFSESVVFQFQLSFSFSFQLEKMAFPSVTARHLSLRAARRVAATRGLATIPKPDPDSEIPVAVIFPGQGDQYEGMADEHVQHEGCKKLYDAASEILGYDLVEATRTKRVHSTEISQPALYVASLSAALREGFWLPTGDLGSSSSSADDPGTMPGHGCAFGLSLGEYSALTYAGCMSFETGVGLVKIRAEAMQAASDVEPSGMVSVVGLDRPKCDQLREAALEASGRSDADDLVVANVLGRDMFVLSGARDACEVVPGLATSETFGAKSATPLKVSGAFHSKYMIPAVDALFGALLDAEFTPDRCRMPVIGNFGPTPYGIEENEIMAQLAAQLLNPVEWHATLANTVAKEAEQTHDAYVFGPSKSVVATIRRVNRRAKVASAQ